jgi:hypothetical protein
MNTIQKEKIATLSIRIITIIMVVMWIFVIIKISNMNESFITQAPYCMMSTFAIFGLLSLLQKGIKSLIKE